MATPESKVKEQIKRLLKKHNVYWHMPMQNGMGAPSLDFICCARGMYVAIEAKAPGGKLTERQALTAKQIEDAGGRVYVVDSIESLEVAALEVLLAGPR